jgi:hypothetical protein
MLGKQAGFDMTTQDGLDQFLAVYNSRLLNNSLSPPLPLDEGDFGRPAPARSMTPKARAEQRKAKKRQRQARKRNRK